jgi:hypothetical protein
MILPVTGFQAAAGSDLHEATHPANTQAAPIITGSLFMAYLLMAH